MNSAFHSLLKNSDTETISRVEEPNKDSNAHEKKITATPQIQKTSTQEATTRMCLGLGKSAIFMTRVQPT